MPDKIILLTDRSSQDTFLDCNRAGFHASYNGPSGRGLQPKGKKFYLVTGTACHLGVQLALRETPQPEIFQAIIDLWTKEGPDVFGEVGEDRLQVVREQRDLSKALTLVWILARQPQVLREYRVMAIEPELRTTLYENDEFQVVLMSRPDAILQRINDGALIQWELKTKSSWNYLWAKGWEHNLQLIGQQLAVAQWATDNDMGGTPIGGALIEVLIKGARKKNKVGVYEQQSPLIYGYASGGDGFLVKAALTTQWRKNATRTLVSDVMSIEEWILSLPEEERVEKCPVVPAIAPSEFEIQTASRQWGLSTISKHLKAEALRLSDDRPTPYPSEGDREFVMDRDWPMATANCYRYGPCRFIPLCWEPQAATDPLGSGYAERIPNHPERLEEE